MNGVVCHGGGDLFVMAVGTCEVAAMRCRAYDPARLPVSVSGCLLLVPRLLATTFGG